MNVTCSLKGQIKEKQNLLMLVISLISTTQCSQINQQILRTTRFIASTQVANCACMVRSTPTTTKPKTPTTTTPTTTTATICSSLWMNNRQAHGLPLNFLSLSLTTMMTLFATPNFRTNRKRTSNFETNHSCSIDNNFDVNILSSTLQVTVPVDNTLTGALVHLWEPLYKPADGALSTARRW